MSLAAGPEKDTVVGDIITIKVGNKPPYGMQLGPDKSGKGLLILSWERLPDGKFSPIQRHGGIHIGDAISHFNEINLGLLLHKDALAMLNDPNTLKKELKFVNSAEYYRKLQGSGLGSEKVIASKNSSAFVSIVRRARLNEEDSKKGKFTQYEIACQLRVPGARLQNEKIFKWSVWKRYNDFQKLHDDMQKAYGWQVENIAFPPSHTFAMDKFSDDFISRRKEELSVYWNSLTAIPQATDFLKHHASETLQNFLEVQSILNSGETSSSIEIVKDENPSASADDPKKPIQRRNSAGPTNRGTSMRRKSAVINQQSSFFDDTTSGQPVTTALLTPSSNINTPPTPSSPPQQQQQQQQQQTATSSAQSSNQQSAGIAAPPAIDPRFAPYATMRKVLPEMALRHKLIQDGFTESEIDNYFALTDPDRPQGSSVPAVSSKPANSTSTNPSASPPPAAAQKTTTATPAAAAPAAAGPLPPKASGARGALLASIAARRIE